jgi:hypothetical protein
LKSDVQDVLPNSQPRLTIAQLETSNKTLSTTYKFLKKEQLTCLTITSTFLLELFKHRQAQTLSICPSPLRLFIHGGPGVGKSTLSHSIGELIRQYQFNVYSCAYCGVAASNLINGQTIHSLFELPIIKKSESKDVHITPLATKKLNQILKKIGNIDFLLVDEISMVDAVVFAQIDQRLRQIKNNDIPFGGIAVILLGDMMQLPPPAGVPLYKRFAPSSVYKELLPSEIALDLFRQFQIFPLTEQIRASSDAKHTSLLESLRDTTSGCNKSYVTDEIIQHIPVLSEEDVLNDPSWCEAPLIVTSNIERHHQNLPRTMTFAKLHNSPVLTWKYPLNDTIAAQLSEDHLNLLYRHNNCLHGYFVKNAPAYLIANTDPTKGLANGTPCFLHSLCFDNVLDPQLQSKIDSALPGELVEIPVPISVNVRVPSLDCNLWNTNSSLKDAFLEMDTECAFDLKLKDTNTILTNVLAKDIITSRLTRNIRVGSDISVKHNASMVRGEIIKVRDHVVIPQFLKQERKPLKVQYGSEQFTIHYSTHTLELGFAITFHKVQGRTMPKLILDLNHRPGKKNNISNLDYFGFYVGFTRVSHSSNIRKLSSYTSSSFSYLHDLKPSSDLLEWMNRQLI